ncbi:MAG: universal stress protein [Cyclobacteriaceae bacterium]
MKKILCPTDFSPTSYNAITYAAKLAQATNADLTLLNVQSLFDITPVEFVTGKEFSIKATGERLQAQCKEVSKVFKISCYAEVEPTYNKLSTVIRDRSHKFDLIVMGSNGADDLYQFFLGSNTYNALAKAKKPVLLIPEGMLYSEIKKMVYAFDYLRERKLPLEPLLQFVRSVKCELTVLQVMEEAYSKKAEEDLREMQFILKSKHGDDLPFIYDTIRSSEVAKSIDSYILQKQPDALALCSLHRNIIENLFHISIIRNITAVCSYPVFVFHE